MKYEGRPSPRFLTYILFVCSVGIALLLLHSLWRQLMGALPASELVINNAAGAE